jgi:hypothetical protein
MALTRCFQPSHQLLAVVVVVFPIMAWPEGQVVAAVAILRQPQEALEQPGRVMTVGGVKRRLRTTAVVVVEHQPQGQQGHHNPLMVALEQPLPMLLDQVSPMRVAEVVVVGQRVFLALAGQVVVGRADQMVA